MRALIASAMVVAFLFGMFFGHLFASCPALTVVPQRFHVGHTTSRWMVRA